MVTTAQVANTPPLVIPPRRIVVFRDTSGVCYPDEMSGHSEWASEYVMCCIDVAAAIPGCSSEQVNICCGGQIKAFRHRVDVGQIDELTADKSWRGT
jgi:hypothetical protein